MGSVPPRLWCKACRSTYTSIGDHVAAQHPGWDAETYLANVSQLDFTGNIPPEAVGYGTVNDTAALAVQASLTTASRAGRFGGLGFRVRNVFPGRRR